MSSPPYVHNFRTGRDYYDSALEDSSGTSPGLAFGPQPVQHTTAHQLFGLTKLGLGVGALRFLGRLHTNEGYRGYDAYIGLARTLEEYSPGKIFRTFQVSNMLSPLERATQSYRYFSPDIIRQLRASPSGQVWLQHMSRLTGQDMTSSRIMKEGFRFEGRQFLAGQTGTDVLLERAALIRSPVAANPALQEGYVRSLAKDGVKGLRLALTTKVPYLDERGAMQAEMFLPIGGHTRFEASKRFLFGLGTSWVERFNKLLRSPGELFPENKATRALGKLLSVESSSGLRTLGKLSFKFGVAAPLLYAGYDLADWLVRKSPFLDNTIFSEGITGAGITLWQKGQMGLSTLAEYTGGHAWREYQEEIAPGSTSLAKLLAFPMVGALTGAGLSYGRHILNQADLQRSGFSLAEASLISSAEKPFLLERLYKTPIPEDLSRSLSPGMTELLHKQTDQLLTTRSGRIAKWIAAKQGETGVLAKATRLFGKVGPTKLKSIVGGLIGLGAVVPFLPGALVPSERPEELERIYSGQQLVPIRKGRWWEAGRSPWEGGRITRYVPHWSVRYLSGARDEAVYGGDYPAIYKFWKENFTYDIEKEHYFDRPYPVTGSAFQDVPLVGPLLSATLGRIIKPPRMMHSELFTSSDSGEEAVPEMPLRLGDIPPSAQMGGLSSGLPSDPNRFTGVLGEQSYRMTEIIGLPGFTMSSFKQAITGTEGIADQETVFQSANTMYGATRDYWEEEIGGAAGFSEAYRRLYPSARSIPQWNAIPNELSKVWWIPGDGDRSPNFAIGDPYAQLPHGEFRLPGPGYERIHPELKGIDPNDWPLLARYRVLADIAPYSMKFSQAKSEIMAAKKRGTLTEEELAEISTIDAQVSAIKSRKQFSPYKYRDRAMTPIEEILASANEEIKTERSPSWFETVVGGYWETLGHNIETPMEYLTPLSPGSKLVHMRTAVEDYERNQVYGTESAFWQHPLKDFMRPFVDSTKHALGWEGIPDHIQKKRSIEEYFDILEYVKYTRLRNVAQVSHDNSAATEFDRKRRETLFGLNPYTFDFQKIFRALPRRERDYFNEFVGADTEERAQILQMVPENEKSLYIARWQLKNAEDVQRAITKGLLSDAEIQTAETDLAALYEAATNEGVPKDKQLWAQYVGSRIMGETYPDWYRRTCLLVERLQGRSIPGPDWVGFNPTVSLDDVKLKVLQNIGESPFDYDIWQDQQRMAVRKPYLEEAAEQLQNSYEATDSVEMLRRKVSDVLAAHDILDAHISVTPLVGTNETRINMKFSEDREGEARYILSKKGIKW